MAAADMGAAMSGHPSALIRPTTVERAFELARSGSCRTVPEIAAVLKREWHDAVDAHLAGQSIRRDLRRAWESAG